MSTNQYSSINTLKRYYLSVTGFLRNNKGIYYKEALQIANRKIAKDLSLQVPVIIDSGSQSSLLTYIIGSNNMTVIIPRNDTEENFLLHNKVYDNGEIINVKDKGIKFGDGINKFSDIPYFILSNNIVINTEFNFKETNPVLKLGQLAFASDILAFKRGNGYSDYNELGYVGGIYDVSPYGNRRVATHKIDFNHEGNPSDARIVINDGTGNFHAYINSTGYIERKAIGDGLGFEMIYNAGENSHLLIKVADYQTAGEGQDFKNLLSIEPGGFYPGLNNYYDIGRPGRIWKSISANTVYLEEAPVITSDARNKLDIREPSDAEIAVALEISGKVFCLKENGSKHIGVLAQDVAKAFERNGLDPYEYGINVKKEWYEFIEKESKETKKVDSLSEVPEGIDSTYHYQLGIRYGELYALLFIGLQRYLRNLEDNLKEKLIDLDK